MELATGDRLGPYEILARGGEGGMGVVYRAHDPRLGRQVAIKLLPAEMAADPHARERLRREAKAAASLDHPYICKIFEIGEQGDALFMVMEYVAGETLHQRLRRGSLPLSEALGVAGEIAEALDEAHARGILHRDLKPSNIMLTPHGHVKVMDFGLAKRLVATASPDEATRDLSEPQLTARGAIVGTPDYMSPEQLKGEPLDVRSDLFSFGVILAEMTSGRHPFRKPSTIETLSGVLSSPPEIGKELPEPVAALARRLLAKAPEDRHASIADVRADLSRISTSSAAVAGEQAGARALAKWRRPAWAAIAVLPLDNYSGDPAQDYFAEGMTDELTTDLAMISRLRVISRGSVMQFKGAQRPPTPEIAKMLDVDAIVEGSVRRVGDTVRITAQLIDAREDRHLWGGNFERNSRDVLALQGELAETIAREIDVRLTPAEQSKLTTGIRVDPAAHDAYLKGRYFFARPSDENVKKAIALFEEAVALSPTFAPAFSGLSDAYLWAGYNEGVMSASAARPKARAAAERAIELDDESAEAHTSLAVFKLFYDYDWEGSEREFRRAIALNPNYAYAHDQFSLGLAFQGRLDEALAEGKRAADLDPLSPQIPIDMAITLIFQGDFQAAKEQARRAAELDPAFYFAPFVDGWVDLEQGKPHEAIPALTKAKAMEAPSFVTAFLAYAHGASGDRARALAELEELRKMSPRGEPLPFDLALVFLGLGDHERAVDYLEQAYAADSQWMGWLYKDRIFDPLRDEPRFMALMKKLRFPAPSVPG